MKILYAVQSTGNGHISRAQHLIPYFTKRVDMDVVLSGPKNSFDLGYPISDHYRGFTFRYTSSGGIHWLKTLLKNNIFTFVKEVIMAPVNNYDLIINDFDPVTAWACLLRNKKCFALSNQFSLTSKKVPKPNKITQQYVKLMKILVPINYGYGFHFKKFGKNIFHPIIRDKVKYLNSRKGKSFVIYLSSHSIKKICKVLKYFPDKKFHVFSNEIKTKKKLDHITLHPINENIFLKKMAGCRGVITAAGFTTPAEAIYLKKPLLVIPMKSQVEQKCNAFILKKMGITVLDRFNEKKLKKIEKWINKPKLVKIEFSDDGQSLVDRILMDFIKSSFVPQDTI